MAQQEDHSSGMQIGVKAPVVTDLNTGTAQYTLGKRCVCHGSIEMTLKTDDPCHSRSKDPSLIIGLES